MTPAAKAVPDGYHTVTPYLTISNAKDAIEFYQKAFGAQVLMQMVEPDGRVGHAEIKIGSSIVMLAGEYPEMGGKSPETLGGTPVSMHLYVEDVDAFVARATAEGATLTRPVADQFYGDRTGGLKDPFGHMWYVATHKEDLTQEEMMQRAATMQHHHDHEHGCCGHDH